MVKCLPASMKIDWLHIGSVVIFLAQMGYILSRYAPLMKDRDKYKTSADGDAFISDFLFHDNSYRSFMTFFVGFQLFSCVLLAFRLQAMDYTGEYTWCSRAKEKHPVCFSNRMWNGCTCCCGCVVHHILYAEMALFVCAWVGWAVLCSDYSGSDNVVNSIHGGGVVAFIVGSFLYFLIMMVEVFSRRTSRSPYVAGALLCIVCVSFISAGGLCIQFAVESTRREHMAWVPEHIAYIMFCVSHILLFVADGVIGDGGGAKGGDDGQQLTERLLDCGCASNGQNPVTHVRIRLGPDESVCQSTVRSLVVSRMLFQ
jgi:hypothetical protein